MTRLAFLPGLAGRTAEFFTTPSKAVNQVQAGMESTPGFCP